MAPKSGAKAVIIVIDSPGGQGLVVPALGRLVLLGDALAPDEASPAFSVSATGGDVTVSLVEAAIAAHGVRVVVPGHGPIARYSDLVDYVAMLTTIRDRVKALMASGKFIPWQVVTVSTDGAILD